MIGKGRVGNEIAGGIFFSYVIQGRDIKVTLPPELTPALASLRDPSAVFAGRDADLARLLALLDPAAPPPAPRTVQVSGLPGVGKTELALHAAWAALDNGWFPGGVLFIDMQGYEPDGQLDAAVALASLLRAVGIPDEHVPATAQDRSGLLKSVLAAYSGQDRPVLLVIDNALTAAQLTPLIPAAGKVLVTSRHTLPLQNATRLELETLTDDAGAELIAAELDLSGGTDQRVTRPGELRLIARLCDGLPLALHIVAALLAAHPVRPLTSMAGDLRDARGRLDEMRFSGPEGDELAVRSAFDLSYRQLDDGQKRLFRLMPLNLGPEIATEAAAALASLDAKAAQRLLLELERAHLIRPGSVFGRWRMHDLIRLYASELDTESDDPSHAFALLLGYYLDRAGTAAHWLEPGAADQPDNPFADRGQALAWLDTEYPNLTPYGHVVVAEPPFAVALTAILFLQLWRYFELRHQTDDWIRLTTHALRIARALEDRRREADALTKLGGAFRQARRFDEAVGACQQAITLQRQLGNRHGEGVALNNLAAAQIEAGRHADAVTSSEEAAGIFRETDDPQRQGIALGNLGSALAGLGRYTESAEAYEKTLKLFRPGGDQRVAGGVLANLGNVLRAAGQRIDEALTAQHAALRIMRENDDRHGTVIALVSLADTLREANRIDEAAAALDEGLSLARELDDARLEGYALNSQGLAQRAAGLADRAAVTFTASVAAFRQAGETENEGIASGNLGSALRAAGRLDQAGAAYQAAASAYRNAGNRRDEGNALLNLAITLRMAKRFDEAIPVVRAARAAFHEAGDQVREADSLAFLGTLLGFGRIDEVVSAYRGALSIYELAGGGDRGLRARRLLQATENTKRFLDEQRAQLAAGKFEEVLTGYRQAAAAARRVEDTYGRGVMSAGLGAALRGAGRFGEAIDVLKDAVAVFRAVGDGDRQQAAAEEMEAARRDLAGAQAAAEELGAALRAAARDTASGDSLATAIDAALRSLGPHDTRLFRLLSACPGPDLSTEAAALLAVADPAAVRARYKELSDTVTGRKYLHLFPRIRYLYGREADATASALAALARMRLVERVPARTGRWRLPDLIRPYATELGRAHAAEDLRDQARALVRIYYFAGGNAASIHLDQSSSAPARYGFASEAQGIGWLDDEYPSLIATVHAAAADNDTLGSVIALDLTRALTHITTRRGRVDDAIALGAPALRAARQLHDRHAEAVVLRNLGGDLMRADQCDEGITMLQAALDVYRDAEDLAGEGTTLTNLGSALLRTQRYDEAVPTLRAAVSTHRKLNRPYSLAVALGNLGATLMMTGHLDEAIGALSEADRIYRGLGELPGRAGALSNLGEALVLAGRVEEAIAPYRRAVALARAVGDEAFTARVLARLAEAYRAADRTTEAESAERAAAEIEGSAGGG
jgi:tetratricopeptide (TPR) repeat protein